MLIFVNGLLEFFLMLDVKISATINTDFLSFLSVITKKEII